MKMQTLQILNHFSLGRSIIFVNDKPAQCGAADFASLSKIVKYTNEVIFLKGLFNFSSLSISVVL